MVKVHGRKVKRSHCQGRNVKSHNVKIEGYEVHEYEDVCSLQGEAVGEMSV